MVRASLAAHTAARRGRHYHSQHQHKHLCTHHTHILRVRNLGTLELRNQPSSGLRHTPSSAVELPANPFAEKSRTRPALLVDEPARSGSEGIAPRHRRPVLTVVLLATTVAASAPAVRGVSVVNGRSSLLYHDNVQTTQLTATFRNGVDRVNKCVLRIALEHNTTQRAVLRSQLGRTTDTRGKPDDHSAFGCACR